jgi:hypothetical protein
MFFRIWRWICSSVVLVSVWFFQYWRGLECGSLERSAKQIRRKWEGFLGCLVLKKLYSLWGYYCLDFTADSFLV